MANFFPPNRLLLSMAVKVVHDGLMALIAMQTAIWLRYSIAGRDIGPLYLGEAGLYYGLITILVFVVFGVHRGIWRYTSFDDLVKILKGVTVATILVLPFLFLTTRLEEFPRSVPFIQWPIAVLLMSSSRIGLRLLRGGDLAATLRRRRSDRIPILLLGPAGQTELFVRMAHAMDETAFPYWITALVDTDPARVGSEIRGKRVIGDSSNLSVALERVRRRGEFPQKLVIADPDMDGAQITALLDECERLGLGLARAPRIGDFQSGAHKGPLELRPVDLRDLLGRPQNVLDTEAIRAFITDKRVLITGAGGTIGAELSRQVRDLSPKHLTLLDSSEHNLYQIDLELAETAPELPRRALLADIRDRTQIDLIFRSEKPEVVFHAAALKHVPLVEANVAEGILTNASGTRNVADACVESGVQTMVLISTDKAVNPTSVMGATKRIAELYCQARDVEDTATRFVTVRFGNVLGSTGSVVPLFQRQLERGGPLTVTHPEVTRYFMTTREAVELVLQASTLDTPDAGGRHADGHIYVLDMGTPVRIVDLATRMIRLAGLKPHADVGIEFIGMRPGEKLHESLFHDQEHLVPTLAAGILLATPRMINLGQLAPALDQLERAARIRDVDQLLVMIRGLVPEFEGIAPPPESGKPSSGVARPVAASTDQDSH